MTITSNLGSHPRIIARPGTGPGPARPGYHHRPGRRWAAMRDPAW